MPAIDSPSARLTVLVIDSSVCTICNVAADCTYRLIFMVALLSQLDRPPTKTRCYLPYFEAHINSSEQSYFALLYFVCREITRRKVALYRGDGDTPNGIWHRWLSLLNGFLHRLTMPRPTLPPAPVYSAAVDSPVINFMADYFRPKHIR